MLAVTMEVIPDVQFYSLVMLIISDRWCTVSQIRQWEKGFHFPAAQVVSMERAAMSDPNNAVECAQRVAELILEWTEKN